MSSAIKLGKEVVDISLAELDLDADDRTEDELSKDKIRPLAANMKTIGQLDPIKVTANGDGGYKVLAGKRRVCAAKLLSWKTIQAVVVESDIPDEVSVLSDNIFTEPINDVQEGKMFKALLEEETYKTQKELAKAFGVGESYVTARLKLLELPDEVQEKVEKGELSTRKASDLVKGGKKSKKVPTKKEIEEATEDTKTVRVPPEAMTPKGESKPVNSIGIWITKETVKIAFKIPYKAVKAHGVEEAIAEEIAKLGDGGVNSAIKRTYSGAF